MSSEDGQHEWQFRLVWREGGKWDATHESRVSLAYTDMDLWADPNCTEAIIQRRRKRDHLDPAPCEGIEHPIWRDWEASPDPEIQSVLVRKGMPFRSLEK